MITNEQAEPVVRAVQMAAQKLPEHISAVIVLIDASDNSLAVLSPDGVDERAVLTAALESVLSENPEFRGEVGPLD